MRFFIIRRASVGISAVMWLRRQMLGLSVNRAGYAYLGEIQGSFLDDGDDDRDVEADVHEMRTPVDLPPDACPAVRSCTYVLAPTLASYPFSLACLPSCCTC